MSQDNTVEKADSPSLFSVIVIGSNEFNNSEYEIIEGFDSDAIYASNDYVDCLEWIKWDGD